MLLAVFLGCGGVPTGSTEQALSACPYIGTAQLALLQRCFKANPDGTPCYVCRDYVGCVYGRGEATTYCTSAQDNCSDPNCQ